MEEKIKLEKFPFYDYYADVLKKLTDEEAGRMAKRICEYMFTDQPVAEISAGRERFYWDNLVEVLEKSKECEQGGKQLSGIKRKMKSFSFPENFYDGLKILNDRQGGQYVKAICGYVFDDKMPKKSSSRPYLFFEFAQRKLDISKVRSRSGSKGGKAKKRTSCGNECLRKEEVGEELRKMIREEPFIKQVIVGCEIAAGIGELLSKLDESDKK